MLKQGLVIAAIVSAISGFIGILAVGMLNQKSVTGMSGITRVSQPAPDFTLPLFEGGEFVLSQARGQPVVINFWASWCPPCREEAPALERTWRTYKEEGAIFVGVDIQDAEADARAYIKEFDVTYPNGPDLAGRITVDYGVIGIPVTFFVSREGIIVRRFVGAISEMKLVEWTEDVLAGVAPSGQAEEGDLESFYELDR